MTTQDLQAAGRLSQRCPACGLIEAAGSYCTRCRALTPPTTWFAQAKGKAAAK